MDEEMQNGGGGPTGDPSASSYGGAAAASAMLRSDPNLLRDLAQQTGTPPTQPVKPPAAAGKMAPLWETVKKYASYFDPRRGIVPAVQNTENSITRGVLNAADNMSNSVVGAAVGISKKTGLYKLGRSPEEQAAFLKWWDQPTDKANPIQFGEDRINRWYGPSQGGLQGTIEGVSQFATGMLTLGKAIPGSGALSTAGKAALVDLSAFDPHQQRLSNLINNSFPRLANPVTRFLAAKESDSEALGRVKSALEGLVVGSTIEGFTGGLKAAKLARAGKAAEAAQVLSETDARVKELRAQEAVHVQPTPDGKFTVAPNANLDAPPALPNVERQIAELTQEHATATGADAEELAARLRVLEAQRRKLAGEPEPRMDGKPTAAPSPDVTATPPAEPVSAAADHPQFSNQSEAESFAASVNYAAENLKRPVGAIDMGAWKRALKEYYDNPDTRDFGEIVDKYGINPNYIQSGEDGINVVKALVDAEPYYSATTRARPKSWTETVNGAFGMFPPGMSREQALEQVSKMVGKTDNLDEYVVGAKNYMDALGHEIRKLSQAADAMPDNPVATDELAQALDALHEFHAQFTGANTGIGRALNANKIPVGEALDNAAKEAKVTPEATQAVADALGEESTVPTDAAGNPQEPKPGDINAPHGPSALPSNAPQGPYVPHEAPPGRTATEGMTRAEIRAMTRMIFMADGDPAQMLAVLRGPRLIPPAEIANDPVATKKWLDYVMGYRIEAMLSGPKTLVVNAINNAIVAFQRPAEYWWAGVRSSNPALRQQGSDMLASMWGELGDSWSAAKKAFMSGENVLDPKGGFANSPGGMGALADKSWLNKLYHAPSRFLMSTDEFFKQLNYRANLRSQILRDMRAKGIEDPAIMAQRMADDMKFAFDPQGGATNPLALQYAKIGTFQNELGGGIGKWLQDGSQQSPLIRLIVPFVRTPTNIFRYAWERTPVLSRFSKLVQEDLMSGDPERIALRKAQTDMGLAVYSSALLFAGSGMMTGAGPSDPELRRQWKEAGNQPYSIRVPGTDTWISYRRMDPAMAPFGIVADLYQMSHDLHDTDATNLASAAIASIMSNLSSKTYMQGVSEFMDAMHSGRGDVVQNLLTTTGGSFVPNVLRQTNWDDTVRETRGMADELMARVPGFSQTLEPRRNLFGEKVMLPPGYINDAFNPFTVSKKPDNQNVADELVKLGRAFAMPSTTKYNGMIDLTDRETYSNGSKQSPYDRMLELMAKPPAGGPSLRNRMETLVQSDAYKHASDDQIINVGGMRWRLANNIIQAMQNVAWAQTLKEYPKLQDAIRQATQLNGASLSGGTSSVQDILTKFGSNPLAKPQRQ